MFDWFARFRGKGMSTNLPPEMLQRYVPPGYYAAPVTEILQHLEMPTNMAGRRLDEMPVQARPTDAVWREPDVLWLWPRPDPSKRWRLFIQEDTRP